MTVTHLEKFGAVTGLAIVLAAALVWLTFAIGRRRIGCTRWPFDCTCHDDWQDDLPGPDSLPAPRAGEPYRDEWDADWQAEPWTDADADQLIATWHGAPAERTVTPDVWDEWWAGLDGLDREMILVRHAREREERLWAELVAETREMCAA